MSRFAPLNWLTKFVAEHYSNEAGKMLVHTGAIGWTLSSLAQIVAIIINDKIPKEQKMFLVPQEAADALVNILSFYVVTQSFNSLAKKLVSSGKLLPKTVKDFLVKNNLSSKIGKLDFNIEKHANLTPELLSTYKNFAFGTDVLATTAGSVISCNVVTPILRNYFAAKRQKTSLEKMHSNEMTKINYLPRPTMVDFQSASNRATLKI